MGTENQKGQTKTATKRKDRDRRARTRFFAVSASVQVAGSLDERKAMEHTELPPMRDWIMRKRLSDRFYRLIATNNGETK